MLKATIVIGAATPPGRLARAMHALASALRSAGTDVQVVDLAAVRLDACDGRPLAACGEETRAAVGAMQTGDVVVLGAPVYRATYPGVLKNLLDLAPIEVLRDKPVGIVAMGGSPHHYLGVDSALRQVLAWFGALALPTSVYLTPSSFGEDGEPVARAREDLAALAAAAALLAERLDGASLGPTPLAAQER
jgi:FMN reductase